MFNLNFHRVKSISSQFGDLVIDDRITLVNGALRGILDRRFETPLTELWIPQNTPVHLAETFHSNGQSVTLEFGKILDLTLYLESAEDYETIVREYSDANTHHYQKAA
jgi:hypothetical protein